MCATGDKQAELSSSDVQRLEAKGCSIFRFNYRLVLHPAPCPATPLAFYQESSFGLFPSEPQMAALIFITLQTSHPSVK